MNIELELIVIVLGVFMALMFIITGVSNRIRYKEGYDEGFKDGYAKGFSDSKNIKKDNIVEYVNEGD